MKGLEAGRQPGQSCILVACGAGRRKGKLRALSRILSLGPSIPHYDFLDFPLLVGSGIPPPPSQFPPPFGLMHFGQVPNCSSSLSHPDIKHSGYEPGPQNRTDLDLNHGPLADYLTERKGT